VKLAIVTNCSVKLGQRAAARLNIDWDAIVTAEEAGFYKPDPVPYRLALERLNVSADQALYVAGSGYDLLGTHRVGLRTYWHNRLGLTRPNDALPPDRESPSLDGLPRWVFQDRSR
jgi:FMN phosphatase YigB (HAD superfamily)